MERASPVPKEPAGAECVGSILAPVVPDLASVCVNSARPLPSLASLASLACLTLAECVWSVRALLCPCVEWMSTYRYL